MVLSSLLDGNTGHNVVCNAGLGGLGCTVGGKMLAGIVVSLSLIANVVERYGLNFTVFVGRCKPVTLGL